MKPANKLIITSLSKEWADSDEVILHACFEILVYTVEKEKLFKTIDWRHSSKTRKAKNEIDDLYKWWKSRIKKSGKKSFYDNEAEQYSEDNKMLIRLIRIRHHLWT
jgi:hypothetical protein